MLALHRIRIERRLAWEALPVDGEELWRRPWAGASVTVRTALAAVVLLGAAIAFWNALFYPVYLGYDAQEHITYAQDLVYHGLLPHLEGAYYTPPLYYVFAGLGTAAAWLLQVHDDPKGGQFVNVAFLLATLWCLLVLVRVVFPRRPFTWVASLAFLVLVPVVPKTVAMFHPESLNLLCSTAALALATWMLAERRFTLRLALLLAAVLAAGQLVRASSVVTAVAVGIGFAAWVAVHRPAVPWRKVGIAVAALALLTGPWYLRQAIVYDTQPLIPRPGFLNSVLHPSQSGAGSEDRSRFLALPGTELLDEPYRPHFRNELFSQTYAELWGDWIGTFAWSSFDQRPPERSLELMRSQSLVGLLPTLLAVGGWLGLLVLLRRRLELLPLLSLPPLMGLAYAYNAYIAFSPDGDVLKATYLLITAPAWAIGFAAAADRLSFNRLARFGIVAALLALAAIDLRFVLYGVRDGTTIF